MNALEMTGIVKRYGEFTAVDQLNLSVRPGEIYGLLGGNGAGKTTSMRMALGIFAPDEGKILWEGQGYHQSLTRKFGYLPEERGLYAKVRVGEQLVYLAKLRGMATKDAEKAVRSWLARFEVEHYLEKRVEELSKGNQQKIQFIAAVLHKPSILILDEAFSGLDPVNVELLKGVVKTIRDEGVAILFSTHRMDHVEELCQQVTILKRSKTIVSGTVRGIKESYPKDKIMVQTVDTLDDLATLPGITHVDIMEDHRYQLTFDERANPRAILQHALSKTEVMHFQVMEPTMNEIFIKVVGEEHA